MKVQVLSLNELLTVKAGKNNESLLPGGQMPGDDLDNLDPRPGPLMVKDSSIT